MGGRGGANPHGDVSKYREILMANFVNNTSNGICKTNIHMYVLCIVTNCFNLYYKITKT